METNTKNLLNIYTPSGIGDLHWTFLKIESISRILNRAVKIHFERNRHHDSLEVKRLISMIPSIHSSEENTNGVKRSERFFNVYPDLSQAFEQGLETDSYSFWIGREFVSGKFLSDIIPEAEINYDYDMCFSPDSVRYAKNIVQAVGRPFVITNASWRSIDPEQVSKYWSIAHYQKTAKLFYETYGVKTVLVGSINEINIARRITAVKDCPYFVSLVGSIPIDYLLVLIMYADLIWGFQGGVNMIADRFKTPTIMLWSTEEHTKAKYNPPRNLITSWMRPESLYLKRYVPLILGKDATPEEILNQSKRMINGMGQERLH